MTKNVLLLGANGKLGSVLLQELLKNNYNVIALVRNPSKIKINHNNLNVVLGSPVDKNDLEKNIKNIDIVISTLGHGFRTKYQIQSESLKMLIPIMEKNNIMRFITVSGAALKTKDDPNSFILNFTNFVFNQIDPYRMTDAKNQLALLEKSNLKWTVIRTPIHSNEKTNVINHQGFDQPKPWIKLSRNAISIFICKNIEKDLWIRKSPIIF